LLVPALLLSAIVEGGGIATYEATRPPPTWTLSIDLAGDGDGQVLVTKAGLAAPLLRCTKRHCVLQLALNDHVSLIAIPGEGATFEGWLQTPMRTPPALRPLMGDPLAGCGLDESIDLVADASARNALECPVAITADVGVEVGFGLVPEEQDVALVPTAPAPELAKIKLPEPPKPIAPVEAEKLDDQPLELAVVPPPPPPPKLITPPPPPEQPADKKPPPPPPPPDMTMVEVPDQKESEKAPDDATKLSDKNRDTDEETRATDTNLDKQSQGDHPQSAESDDHTSPEIGGPDDKVAHLEHTEATSDEARDDSDHSGNDSKAEGAKTGEGGDDGENGTGEKPGQLAMREIGGRGSITDQKEGDGRKRGQKGAPGLKTQLAFNDYQRIVGQDKADQERDLAAKKLAAKRGRWERKLEAIRSSLENFTPDVRPGNQTALKTRANPFAVYVARMHRKIHERWGFGFLEDLDSKPSSSPMNNFDLVSTIEISIDPDGTVHKTTIAKTSGVLEFDVAALDAVLSSGPYEPTPEAIRSVDQRVYLRWGFYRNWRQCGTFNVEPYILTDIPGGIEPIAGGPVAKGPVRGDAPVTPVGALETQKASPSSSVNDAKALYAANLWVSGFAQADVAKMSRFSIVPFSAGGQVAAQTKKDLEDMYKGLIVESGPLRDWKLMTAAEYGAGAAGDSLVLQVRTSKETFAVVMEKTNSGEFRAVQIVR
jgi:TonB family protein